jgi:hypothetical protein
MAKNTYADLSVTPASNTDLLNQNSSGSANANTIDTLIQNFAGMTARYYGDVGGLGTVGGSANAITVTSLSTYQSLASGMQIAIKASAANTGAATLNLDGLGVKSIRTQADGALVGGEIVASGRYLLQYDAALNSAAGGWTLVNQQFVGRSTTETLTNKRLTPRVTTITSSGTPTVNTDNCDFVNITAQAAAITSMTTNLSGTPTIGDALIFQIKDNGTARAITWGASFTAKGVALPTTTVISKLLTVAFLWNGSNWGCVGSAQEA